MSRGAGCLTQDELTAYLQGALSNDDRQAVADHVARCDGCAELVEAVRRHLPSAPGTSPMAEDPTGVYYEPQDEPTRSLVDGEGDLEPLPFKPPDYLGNLNGYEVVRVLGRGGYGIVFEARDKVLQRSVAIKVLARDLASQATPRRRFIREARACAAINHPNVVTIYGVEEAGDVPFIIMELVQGETLSERIRREPKLDVIDILRVAAQTAQGLAAAHAQGIIHRDVKPGNIMLVDSLPRVKITDFGLARVAAENLELTSRGLAVGTPAYMSPEQVRGLELDARSDLFALGCVVYAMITGHSPFHGRSSLDIARRIEEFDPPPLRQVSPGVPEFLESIVQQLLQKSPESRFQSAAEVADLLNRHLAVLNQTPSDRLPHALHMPRMDPVPARPAARFPWKTAAVASFCLILLAATAWFGLHRGGASLAGYRTGEQAQGAVAGKAEAAPAEVLPRRLEVTVARSGEADAASISEALQQVAPGGTITILDQERYEENLRLTDGEQLAGVQILAPAGATLTQTPSLTVLYVRDVPRLRIEGLRIEAAQSQFAIEVNGDCPGLVLQDLQVRRHSLPTGIEGHVAAVVFRHGARGTSEEPITMRNVVLRDSQVGVVIGNPSVHEAVPAHILIDNCRIQGLNRETSTLLALLRRHEQVRVQHCLFTRGGTGLSLLIDEQGQPDGCQIVANTWHDVRNWIGWTGPETDRLSLELHHNLVTHSGQIPAMAQLLSAAITAPPRGNAAVAAPSGQLQQFAALADITRSVPLQSLDIDDPHFLEPEWSKLDGQAAAVPGGHRSAAEKVPAAGRRDKTLD